MITGELKSKVDSIWVRCGRVEGTPASHPLWTEFLTPSHQAEYPAPSAVGISPRAVAPQAVCFRLTGTHPLWELTKVIHTRRVNCLVFALAIAASGISKADSGLYWLYQFTSATTTTLNPQTALAMGGSKSWPVVFAPTLANGSIQSVTLNPFRNTASNTYWSPLANAFAPPSNQPILSAKSTSMGQIGFAVTVPSSISVTDTSSVAYIGTRQSGLGSITVGALGLAVNPKQELVAPTFGWLAGSGIASGATRGVALDPWGNFGAVVANNFSYYEKNTQSGWQSAQLNFTTLGSLNYYADLAYDGSGTPTISYASNGTVIAAQFDIRSGQWQQNQLGVGNSVAPIYPTMATDSKGGVGVSWVATSGTSTVMYAYKPRDGAWAIHPVTSSVSVPLTIGGLLSTEAVRPQLRVGLDFDANDLPVISFVGASGRVYLAYDPILQPDVIPDTLRVVSGGESQIDTSFVTGAVRLVKQGAGTLVRQGAANNDFGTLVEAGELVVDGVGTIASGSVTVMSNASLRVQGGDLASNTVDLQQGGRLSVAEGLRTFVGGVDANAGGSIDVGTSMITVVDGLSQTDLLSALRTGRGDGMWNGAAGIGSTAIAGGSAAGTIGWLDNGDGSMTFGYAAFGDTNLDWQIDVLDVANFISTGKYNSGLSATWAEGDFNYDGFSDVLDLAVFMSSGLFNAGSYNGPAGSITAVPEPSTLAIVGFWAGAAALVAMRRQRAA
jgi:hypothetical protein